MNLTADNTAIVLDSTADFPDAAEHPRLELDVHEGGQPHYHLLLSAE